MSQRTATADPPADRAEPWVAGALTVGLVALLASPLAWLVGTFFDPAVEGIGPAVAVGVAALVGWSWRSGPAPADPGATRTALRLLALTATLRLAGQVLAIHLVSGLALVADVAALGYALRLHRRPIAVHPVALAGLFAFALPLAEALQRVLGFPLRLASTVVAEAALRPFAPGLHRAGTLLADATVKLNVDLPCSGAHGLATLGAVALALACRRRLGCARLLALIPLTLGGALLANVARLALLWLGATRGWAVFEAPLHDLLGLAALATGMIPMLYVASRWPRRGPVTSTISPRAAPLGPASALTFVTVALAVNLAPARPLDVGAASTPVHLPVSLGDWRGAPLPLDDLERRCFARFGGAVAKARYADDRDPPFGVLVVRTSAPLRHLHGPDRCLRGAGHRVERLGVRAGLPVVLWRSTAPDGAVWRVETLFVDAAGHTAATVGEVAWRWLRAPAVPWSLVQRISPWSACEADPNRCAAFSSALGAALDLPREEVIP